MRAARGFEPPLNPSIEGLPSRIYFSRASSTPVGGSLLVLRRYADWLAARRSRRVVVLGHANQRSWPEAARELALARSRSVRDLLVFLGARRGQIGGAGFAKLHPLNDRSTTRERQLQRFVEIIAVPGGRVSAAVAVPLRGRRVKLRRVSAR